MRILFVVMIMFFIALAIPGSAFTITGDTITYENAYGKVTQTPHTITGMSGYPEINFTSKFATTQTLDIAFGFDSESAVPSNARYYNPHYVTSQESYTCSGFFNYTTTPNKHFWCYEIMANNTYKLLFDHDFVSGDIPSKTAYWSVSEFKAWTDITSKFDVVNYNYDDKDKWYLISGVTFEPGETKTLRFDMTIKPGTSGKYDIFIKRSDDSFSNALYYGNYVLLDPWYNSTFAKCRNLSVTNGAKDKIAFFNLTFDSDMENDFDDIRFVNASCGDGGYEMAYGLRSKTDEYFAAYDIKLTGTGNISVYYDNPSAGSNADMARVWGDNLVGYWTFDECSGSQVNDIMNNNDGWFIDGSTWNSTTKKYGCGGQFNGSNRVGVPDNNLLDLPTNWTIEYYGYLSASNGANGQRAVSKRWESGTSNYDFGVQQAYLQTIYQGSEDLVTTNNFTLGTMRFAAATKRGGSPQMIVFLDSTMYNDTSYDPGSANTLNLTFGSIGYGGSHNQYNWRGVIDEVRLFNTTIDPGVIATSHYSATDATFVLGAEQSGSITTTAFLWLNGTQGNATYTYSPTTQLNVTANISHAGLWIAIFRNGTLVANSTTTATIQSVTGAGLWNYTAYYGGNATYTASSVTYWANVSKAANPVYLNLTLYNGSSWINSAGFISGLSYNYSIPIMATATGLVGTIKMYRANCTADPCNYIDITSENATWDVRPANQPDPINYRWTYKINATGNANYSDNTTFNSQRQDTQVYPDYPDLTIGFNISSPAVIGYPSLVTCSGPSQITANLYNNTSNVGNPYVLNPLIAGTYVFSCNTTGNANYTAGSANISSMTYTLSGALVIGQVVDEKNTSKVLTFDITIYNATYSTTSNGITTYNNNEVRGDMTITISSEGYGARRYYISVPSNGSFNMTGYLVSYDYGQDTAFTIEDILENPITNARIDFYKLYGSSWTIVSQGITDDTGKFTFSVDPTADYKIGIYASGYDMKNISLIPVDSSYVIYMYKALGDIPEFFSYYRNITFNCGFNTTTRTRTCTFADTSGHMTKVWLNVTYWSANASSVICSNSSTASSGVLTCVYPSNYQNRRYIWSLKAETHSDPNSFTIDSGIDEYLIAGMGIVGIILAFIIVGLSGLIGFEVRPAWGVILTILGIGGSMAAGFMTIEVGSTAALSGLAIAGGILILKVEKHGG